MLPRRRRVRGPAQHAAVSGWWAALLGSVSLCSGCTDLDRFDTSGGGAYCGSLVGGQFVREGFSRTLRMELTLDIDHLSSLPGRITTDDSQTGPCAPRPQFDRARLRVPQKLLADPLSTLSFGDEREHNLLAWVDSTCRGTLLAAISLMKNDSVEVRLLLPPGATNAASDTASDVDAGATTGNQNTATGDAADDKGGFALFQLERRSSCGF